MNPCEELIAKLTETLPEICTINDLIRAGLVSNRSIMEYYRRKKLGPPFLRFSSRKIYYPRSGILKWMRDNSHAGEKKIKSERENDHFQIESRMA